MKATEVYVKKPVEKKVVEAFRFRPHPHQPNIPSAIRPMANIDENIVGVKTRPGHEIHRIRNRINSHLWDKIKNWD